MTASPESLHVLVHRAGSARRDEADWWGSAIETGLAACAGVRHHTGHREAAERAVERLVDWWHQEPRRRVSADAVAVALTAYAAHALARRDATLTTDAAAAVADMARRDPAVVPDLHVALAVWALADVVPDRDATPWPDIRHRLDKGRAYGVDEALRAYARAVAARTFDAPALVRAMLNSVPTGPSVPDGAAVTWLLSATVERCASNLPSNEPGLLALVDQRARLVDRLAVEVSESSFLQPTVADFDGDSDDPVGAVVHISSMEALLIDCALASPEPATPWVTFDEARNLFGERELDAERRIRRGRLLSSQLVAAVGLLATLSLVLVFDRYDVQVDVTRAAAVVVSSLGGASATAVARASLRPRKLVDAVGVFFVTVLLVGVVLLVNALVPQPFLQETTVFTVGGLLGAVSLVGWLVLARDE